MGSFSIAYPFEPLSGPKKDHVPKKGGEEVAWKLVEFLESVSQCLVFQEIVVAKNLAMHRISKRTWTSLPLRASD